MNWVVFDYGEVISRRTAAMPLLASRSGVTLADFEPAYWAARDRYDRGCTDLRYWTAVGGQLGVEVDDEMSRDLTAIDVDGWLAVEEDTLDLLRDLSAAGARLALLSNAPSSFGRAAERQPWAAHFTHLMFSGDVGMAKPDPEIWSALVDRLGTTPQDCLFLDDRQVNVDGARAAGLRAERWLNATEMRQRLGEFGIQ